jgi:hypothetical protein
VGGGGESLAPYPSPPFSSPRREELEELPEVAAAAATHGREPIGGQDDCRVQRVDRHEIQGSGKVG